MTNQEEKIGKLIEKQSVSFVGSIDENDFPCIKAMLPPCKREGLKYFYWHTNNASMKINQYKNNSKACVYFYDSQDIAGVTLTGTMEVLDDIEIKKEIWKNGFDRWYTGGMDGGDFIIIKFTAENGRYYHNLQKENFKIK